MIWGYNFSRLIFIYFIIMIPHSKQCQIRNFMFSTSNIDGLPKMHAILT